MPARKKSKSKGKTKRSGGNRRRGKGNIGGKGRAGRGKRASHRKQEFLKKKDRLGKKGFKRPQTLKEEKETINVGKINEKAREWVEEGLAEKKEEGILLDISELGYDKVLGRGGVNKNLIIEGKEFSEKARDKIEKAGGKIKKK